MFLALKLGQFVATIDDCGQLCSFSVFFVCIVFLHKWLYKMNSRYEYIVCPVYLI